MIRSLRRLGLPRCAAGMLLLLAAPFPASAAVAGNTYPFAPGEKIDYAISWSHFITAGVGSLSVRQGSAPGGKPAYSFDLEGESTGIVAFFHKVHDHTVALFDPAAGLPIRADIRIEENTYHKRKSITFDRQRQVATYTVDNDEPEEFAIEPGTVGPISVLYVFRAMHAQLRAGQTLIVPLFDDKKMYGLRIRVLDRPWLRLAMGRVRTIHAVADMQTEGIFGRAGQVEVWFSDDEAFAPVQVRAKIVVGSIFATMTGFEGTPIQVVPDPK